MMKFLARHYRRKREDYLLLLLLLLFSAPPSSSPQPLNEEINQKFLEMSLPYVKYCHQPGILFY